MKGGGKRDSNPSLFGCGAAGNQLDSTKGHHFVETKTTCSTHVKSFTVAKKRDRNHHSEWSHPFSWAQLLFSIPKSRNEPKKKPSWHKTGGPAENVDLCRKMCANSQELGRKQINILPIFGSVFLRSHQLILREEIRDGLELSDCVCQDTESPKDPNDMFSRCQKFCILRKFAKEKSSLDVMHPSYPHAQLYALQNSNKEPTRILSQKSDALAEMTKHVCKWKWSRTYFGDADRRTRKRWTARVAATLLLQSSARTHRSHVKGTHLDERTAKTAQVEDRQTIRQEWYYRRNILDVDKKSVQNQSRVVRIRMCVRRCGVIER